jgi:3-hydroxybutyryl-CoA dehydrogenase
MTSTVAVVGAGVMGRGVALSLALYGMRVVLIDLHDRILNAAWREINRSARLMPMLDAKLPRPSEKELAESICLTRRLDDASDAEMMIDNTTEDWDVKRGVYRELDAICPTPTMFAANTSAIPITRLAGETARADRVIGMHFMNPAPLKPTVEVIRGRETSDETVERALALLARIGKQGIVINDSPGFVTNRIMMLMVNEAITLLQEKVATAEQIDSLFVQCFAHKLGPLGTADLIGLDTVLRSLQVLHDNLRDDKFVPCALLVEMVKTGRLGRKSGQGFFRHGS